jgi:hypothetical protein
MAQQPVVGRDLVIMEASRSHSDTSHSVGLLWTSNQPDAETSTWQHNNRHKRHTSNALAGLEPTVPATEWPQTRTFDRAVAGFGSGIYSITNL